MSHRVSTDPERHLLALEVQRPDGFAVAHLPVGQEAPAPVQALRTIVVGVHRKPNILRVRSGLGDAGDEESDRRRPNSLPLLRDINGQVKQFSVTARVSKATTPTTEAPAVTANGSQARSPGLTYAFARMTRATG